ncbi:hypothetical protein HON52_03620 [Candidatus Uhrbacteria bacterium]|jgi:hypothetical protein|nr:hypothetical protein [Candidatus Uhrbacteria bacterium]
MPEHQKTEAMLKMMASRTAKELPPLPDGSKIILEDAPSGLVLARNSQRGGMFRRWNDDRGLFRRLLDLLLGYSRKGVPVRLFDLTCSNQFDLVESEHVIKEAYMELRCIIQTKPKQVYRELFGKAAPPHWSNKEEMCMHRLNDAFKINQRNRTDLSGVFAIRYACECAIKASYPL